MKDFIIQLRWTHKHDRWGSFEMPVSEASLNKDETTWVKLGFTLIYTLGHLAYRRKL